MAVFAAVNVMMRENERREKARIAIRGNRPSYLPESSFSRQQAYEAQEQFWDDLVCLRFLCPLIVKVLMQCPSFTS